MEFRVLGPLEVADDNGLVALGGTRQRATLALLLLHTNQVVPTSQLLNALWSGDRVPVTARKILQNAIWRLRRALTATAGAPEATAQEAPELLTRAPGYMVRVPTERVDLLRFQRLAARGKAALSTGDADNALPVLREALALWRGPALADLAEEGAVWDELAVLEKKRLDVMEDRFEAELLCGGHQPVLRELEGFVEAEPLRERASQQLMLALYRSGRQADALGVYARVRTALVDGLGLEPGRQMQLLQQSILAQDPKLDLPVARESYVATRPASSAPAPAPAQEAYAAMPSAEPEPEPEYTPAPEPEPHRQAGTSGDMYQDTYQDSTVLMLRFGLGPAFDDLPEDDIDRVLDMVCQLAREEMEKWGGQAVTAIGSTLLGLFGQDPDLPVSAERAIRAACAVRDSLGIPAGPLAPRTSAIRGLVVHAAVATGTAIVCHWPTPGTGPAQPWIGGDIVDLCEGMLAQTPSGEVHVCDETRRRSERGVTYHGVAGSAAKWQVRTVGPASDGNERCPALSAEHESELDLMAGFLHRTRLRSTPHLLIVAGDSSLDRTRLLMEFQRRAAHEDSASVRVLTCTVPERSDAPSIAGDLLATYCGITPEDDSVTALGKLEAAVGELARSMRLDDPQATLARLGLLLSHTMPEPRQALRAWRQFVALAAHARPLVLIWDDVHLADDTLLDTLGQLAVDCADVPLLNVVGAHSRLLHRRPTWSGGFQHTMMLRLAPMTVDALEQLLQSLFTQPGPHEGRAGNAA